MSGPNPIGGLAVVKEFRRVAEQAPSVAQPCFLTGVIILLVVILFVFSSCSALQPSRLVYPTTAGTGPINSESIEKYDSIVVLDFIDAPGAPNSGKTVAALISTMLANSGITLVERARLEQIYEEQRLQLMSSDEKINTLKVGKLVGAKGVVVGEVGKWQSYPPGTDVSINLRFVDVESGALLFSGLGYWPEPIKGPTESAALKVLQGIYLKFTEKIGTGTGVIGFTYDLKIDKGVPVFSVAKVLPRLPAEAAGLRVGDIILSCNGALTEKWKTKLQFAKGCHADGGQSISLEVARGDQRLLLNATAVKIFPK